MERDCDAEEDDLVICVFLSSIIESHYVIQPTVPRLMVLCRTSEIRTGRPTVFSNQYYLSDQRSLKTI